MIFRDVSLVFLGAGLGGVLRWSIGAGTLALCGSRSFPLATFIANFVACALIGFFSVSSLKEGICSSVPVRLFLIPGFLGGLSTMSAFGLETVTLLRRGDFLIAGTNIFLTLGACFWVLWLISRVAES